MSETIILEQVLAGHRGRNVPWREALELFAEVISKPRVQPATSDIGAAATLLVEMLAGGVPWDSEGRAQERDLDALRRRLAEQAPDLPVGVVAAITIAFAPDPRLRYQTTADFVQALHEGAVGFLPRTPVSGGPAAARPAGEAHEAVLTPPREVIGHPRLTSLVGIPTLVALGLTAVWWNAHDRAPSGRFAPVKGLNSLYIVA